MNNYYMYSTFTFGRFKGKTLKEVIAIKPSYIDWCILHLDNFFFTKDTLAEILFEYPAFTLSKEAEKKRSHCEEQWELTRMEEEEDDDDEQYFVDDTGESSRHQYSRDELELAD